MNHQLIFFLELRLSICEKIIMAGHFDNSLPSRFRSVTYSDRKQFEACVREIITRPFSAHRTSAPSEGFWIDVLFYGEIMVSENASPPPSRAIKTAVILAGGKGTRLKPFTMTIPKPLLPLGDTPILQIVIEQLVATGISRIVLTLGHMAPLILASVGDGSRWGIGVESILEREPLGTAGSLRAVENLDDNFLVMNADLLTTLDYRELFKYHLLHDSVATIALSKREVLIDYGVVRANADGSLDAYIEKPTIPYTVSMGINVLSRKSLEFVPAAGRFDMPDLMLAMHRGGHTVHCYETDCYWKDIGRFDDYTEASEDFVKNCSRFLPRGSVERK